MIWKDVPEYKGILQVSNTGIVVSLDRTHTSSKGRTIFVKGKILSQRTNRCGYSYILIRLPSKKRMTLTVHRLVASAFIPKIKNKTMVNHKDSDKSNNHVSNLEWVDNSENQIHAIKNGYGTDGEKNKKSKLTYKQVEEIRNDTTSKIVELGKKYGVAHQTISAIQLGKIWKYPNKDV